MFLLAYGFSGFCPQKLVSLWLSGFACLSRFCDGCLPTNLSSKMGLRSHWFLVCSTSPYKMRRNNFQVFQMLGLNPEISSMLTFILLVLPASGRERWIKISTKYVDLHIFCGSVNCSIYFEAVLWGYVYNGIFLLASTLHHLLTLIDIFGY